jgi:hypothetical protein
LRDHRGLFIDRKPDLTLEAVRTGNQQPHAAPDGIGSDPAFVRVAQVSGSRHDGGLDPFAAGAIETP